MLSLQGALPRVLGRAESRSSVTQSANEELKLIVRPQISPIYADQIFAGPTALFIQKNLRKSV